VRVRVRVRVRIRYAPSQQQVSCHLYLWQVGDNNYSRTTTLYNKLCSRHTDNRPQI